MGCWVLTAAAITSFLTFRNPGDKASSLLPLYFPMSRSSSLKPPPRPPPYRGRGGGPGGQEGRVEGSKESRERFRSGSPTRIYSSSRRGGGSVRPARGRSISVTVCQYAAPKDKKLETLKVKQRPLSLSPASSISSVVSSSQDTEEFWGRYRRGPAPTSIIQLLKRAVGLGQGQVGGEVEPTYAEIYRGEAEGGGLPGRGRTRQPSPPPD